MLRRYELTDQEWEQVVSLLPPEKTGKPGRPSKDNRTMLNGMVWIARSGAPWRDLPERYGPWNSVCCGLKYVFIYLLTYYSTPNALNTASSTLL